MGVALFRDGVLLRESVTEVDGRPANPLLAGEPLRIGPHELRFGLGAYFVTPADPPWLDVVPVRFTIAEPESDHMVKLIVAPSCYTVSRGD